ncbi:hypothetical protein EDD11_000877 [Mortierella claussenii]|nr:hypothetical protein EDD11_000877 [Mortierella claussenii]
MAKSNDIQGPIDLPVQKRTERIDIGDGLVMRWSTRKDAQNVADCMAEAFRWIPMGVQIKDEYPKPNAAIHGAIKRLLCGNHGVMTEFDFALVENTLAREGQNPIIACISLQATPGYYGKVRLLYGKPECVGTHPDYRGKGLIRRLFHEMIHPASDIRGDVIQIIPGISHFYRQFGYEYAVGNPSPRIIENLFQVMPELQPVEQKSDELNKIAAVANQRDDKQDFTLRVPTLDDIPYLLKLSTPEKILSQAQVGLLYDEAYWKYTIRSAVQGAKSKHDAPRISRIIQDTKSGCDCGIVVAAYRSSLAVRIFTLEDGYHYRDALVPVLKQVVEIANQPNPWGKVEKTADAAEVLKEEEEEEEGKQGEQGGIGEKDATADGNDNREEDGQDGIDKAAQSSKSKIHTLSIFLDPKHPVALLLEAKSKLAPHRLRLYTRILSYAKFILKVAPELEDRIAHSCLAGITATCQFDFFRKVHGSSGRGLEIILENGRIISATDDYVPLSPEAKMHAAQKRIAEAKKEGRPDKKPTILSAEFAPLTFTRLLVGDLSIDQMLDFYGECGITGGGDETKMLLGILFPKQQFYLDMFWW